MKTPTARLEKDVKRAAELRVSGLSWEQVAKKMRRNAGTIHHWPSNYPEHWEQLSDAARRALTYEASDEAVSVLRTQLRGKEDKVSQVAAKELMHNKQSLDGASTPYVPSNLHRFADYLEGLSDDEFTSLMGDNHLEHLGRPPVVPLELETAPSEA